MFQVPAQFIGASHKQDSTMTARFNTSELSAKEKLKLIEHLNLAGWIVFSENSISDGDLPKEDSGFDKGKSPSQRLRSVIFKFWKEKKSDEYPIFQTYYALNIEKFIEKFKELLNN